MAKTTSDRPRKHIRDVFATHPTVVKSHHSSYSHGSVQNDSSPTPKSNALTQHTRIEPSNGDVFFAKPAMNDDNNKDEKRYVKIPDSRKKRLAPRPPPEITSRPVSHEKRDSQSLADHNNVSNNSGLRSLETTVGHHLVTKPNIDISHSVQNEQECYKNKPSTEEKHDGLHDVDNVIDCEIYTDVGSLKAHSIGLKGRIVNNKELMLGTKVTYINDNEDKEEEETVPCPSVLSDSGTVSGSSGYISDVVDYSRTVTMNETDMIGRVSEDEEGYQEEEFTLDFGDEDEETKDNHGRQTLIYKEYKGEDYAFYLQDDQESGTDYPIVPPRKSRYIKKKEELSQQSDSNSLTLSRGKLGFKEKFSQMFTISKQNRNSHSNGRSGNIQNFTFADSKMGETFGGHEDSTKENHNMAALGLRDAWWTDDTLAARSLRRRPDQTMKHKRSSSVGDILDSDFSDTYQPKQDFESYRKAHMYDTKSSSGSSKKGNIWSKIGRTLRKKDKTKYYNNNTTHNPLAMEADLQHCNDINL